MSEHLSDTNVGNIEYIRREDALKGQKTGTFANGICFVAEPCVTVEYIESLEQVDVVPVSAYKQVMWERDTAVEQLKQIGKGLGEVMDDVAPVRHGRWLPIVSYNNTYKCSECGRLLVNIADGLKMVAKHYPYCHCGAKMDAHGEE